MIPLSIVAKATLILIVALVALRWTRPAAASVRQVRGRLGARGAAILAAAGVLVAAVGPLRAQGTQVVTFPAREAPAFDVVSIMENKSGDLVSRIRRLPGGRIMTINFPLRDLILSAYVLQPTQLVNAPDWIIDTRFDITAQAKEEFPLTPPDVVGPAHLMMQRLLADRFKLVVHIEKREMPIYALTLARNDRKLGPRLTEAGRDCEALMAAMMKPPAPGEKPPTSPQLPSGAPACGLQMHFGGRLWAGGTSMEQLARHLSNWLGRITVDRTGLTGGFDFEVGFAVEPSMLPAGVEQPPPLAPDQPPLVTALAEQLGVKLQAERAPVEVLVIDRLERPTEN
jgi:uncharacterized protein (TIGR03435 family)